MNISAVAIRRPVFTVMMTVALLVLGWVGFRSSAPISSPTSRSPSSRSPSPTRGRARRGRDSWSPSRSRTRSSASTASIACARSRARAVDDLVMFKLGVDLRGRHRGARAGLADPLQAPARGQGADHQPLRRRAAPMLIYTLRGKPLAVGARASSPTTSSSRRWSRSTASPRSRSRAAPSARSTSTSIAPGSTRSGLDRGAIAARLRAANLTVPAGHFDEGKREISVRTRRRVRERRRDARRHRRDRRRRLERAARGHRHASRTASRSCARASAPTATRR